MIEVERKEEIWRRSESQWLSVTIDRPLWLKQPNGTMVICHGLTGDKIGPQKLLSNISSNLVLESGLQVIRFDFSGSGLSSGEFIDTSFESMVEDALFVANTIKTPLIWLGISTGALIALIAAAGRNRREDVIIVSNGLSDNVHFTDLEDDFVPLRGGQLTLRQSYFKKREKIFPKRQFLPHVGKATVILGSKDSKHYQESHNLKMSGIDLHIIEEADHLFSEPDNRFQLYHLLKEIINVKK